MVREQIQKTAWLGAWVFVLMVPVTLRPLAGQRTHAGVGGIVVDSYDGHPIPVAVISVNGDVTTTTDQHGRFNLAVPETGTSVIGVRRLGYAPVELDVWIDSLSTTLDLRVQLAPLATELAPIEVQAEGGRTPPHLAGFEARRRMGFGRFADREQIEKWSPVVLTDVLQHLPGINVIPNPGYGVNGDRRRFLVESSRIIGRIGGGSCAMQVYLDGMFVGTTGPGDLPLDDLIPVHMIEAVEVYRSTAEIPAEFNRTGSDCGVIVFWTR